MKSLLLISCVFCYFTSNAAFADEGAEGPADATNYANQEGKGGDRLDDAADALDLANKGLEENQSRTGEETKEREDEKEKENPDQNKINEIDEKLKLLEKQKEVISNAMDKYRTAMKALEDPESKLNRRSLDFGVQKSKLLPDSLKPYLSSANVEDAIDNVGNQAIEKFGPQLAERQIVTPEQLKEAIPPLQGLNKSLGDPLGSAHTGVRQAIIPLGGAIETYIEGMYPGYLTK